MISLRSGFTPLAVLSLVAMLPPVTSAQRTQVRVSNFPAYKVYSGTLDGDGLPTSGARLCLDAKVTSCYTLLEKRNDMQFGLEPKTRKVSVQGGGSLVLFSGTFSGGGSGTLDELALLQYEQDQTLWNVLPVVQLTEQSDHAVWQLSSVSSMPVLLTADFVWGKNETHFEPHHFEVRAYLYDSAKQIYVEKMSYQTSRRYPSLDQVSQIKVLVPEQSEILRRLNAKEATAASKLP
jgi:hypothetical protein